MKKTPTFKIYICISIFCSLNVSQSLADESATHSLAITEHQCFVNNQSAALQNSPTNTLGLAEPVKDAVYLEADEGNIQREGISSLSGNVIIQQNSTIFSANKAKLNRDTNEVFAKGNVVLKDRGIQLKSPSITYNLDKQSGIITEAEYTLGNEGIHGKSKKVQQSNKHHLELNDATISSCPINHNSWHLASSNISVNQKTQIATAKHVRFNIKDTPVFYFPWLKFPINNQRLSGFLSPSVRLQTNAGITIPYYLNLAPNYDATLQLTTLKNRGLKFDNEFRYLTNIHKGTFNYNFISNDSSFNSESRNYFNIKHLTQISQNSLLTLNAEGVSDESFFDDFSSSLETSTRPALERRLQYRLHNKPWYFSTALEDYQVFNSSNDPYSKLPEIKLNYAPKNKPKDLKVELNSELIYFDKKNDVTGLRTDLNIKLEKKWGDESWFLKPKFKLQHSHYTLDNATSDSTLSRTLPTITLDGGLFFDRQIASNNYTQTLEPRLFYTTTPFKDQSQFPVFDTAETNFSESNQLFLENRFTGKDRIADTNQLTVAISSRIQDRTEGNELFKATLGQVFNFSDRKVTLPGGTILTGKRSDLLLELSGRLSDKLRVASTINLKTDKNSSTNYDLRLIYQDDKKRIANLSFRRLDTELKHVSFSTALPVSDKWSVVANIDQDTKNNRNLESLLGFEYHDCCWKSRLVMKRYLSSDNISYENPIFLEFELKGLGNIGSSATRQIKDKIYGYDDK